MQNPNPNANRFGSVGLGAALLLGTAFFLLASPAEAGRPRPPAPAIVVTSPGNGSFTSDGSVVVTGQVQNVAPGAAVVTINGAPVTVDADGSFSGSVTLNPTIVFNPIETRLESPEFKIDRRVVIAGSSVADGDFSLESLALRLNDSGLDQLEPVVTGLVDLDLATLVPPNTQVIDEYCVLRIIVCTLSADAFVEASPPPSIGSFAIDVDSQPGMAYGDVLLNDLFIKVKVQKGSIGLIGFTCHVTVTADTTDILGNFGLEPMAGAPEYVDVQQLGGAQVVFGGFHDTTDCDGIFGSVLEFFVDLLVGDIQSLMRPAFENFLNTPDLAGNTPVAGAIETALSDIHIAGPIGEGLNVALEAPLFEVAEDADGITLGADARIQAQFGTGPGQCAPPAGAPDLPASYDVSEPFPSFGATTPGGIPYDLGIAISTSAFNQLLKAQIECGLLQSEIREIDYAGLTLPLTAGLLSVLLPEFSALNNKLPMVALLQPTTAPLLTGDRGPGGEDAELRIGQLIVDFRRDSPFPAGFSYLKLAVDFRVGVDFDLDPVTGALAPTLAPIAPEDITVSVASSYFSTITPEEVQAALPSVLTAALPDLSSSLGSFPIPDFFGFHLAPVETGRNGQFLAIFANLEPAVP